eukprot:3332850-Rhodomonas_salina.2
MVLSERSRCSSTRQLAIAIATLRPARRDTRQPCRFRDRREPAAPSSATQSSAGADSSALSWRSRCVRSAQPAMPLSTGRHAAASRPAAERCASEEAAAERSARMLSAAGVSRIERERSSRVRCEHCASAAISVGITVLFSPGTHKSERPRMLVSVAASAAAAGAVIWLWPMASEVRLGGSVGKRRRASSSSRTLPVMSRQDSWESFGSSATRKPTPWPGSPACARFRCVSAAQLPTARSSGSSPAVTLTARLRCVRPVHKPTAAASRRTPCSGSPPKKFAPRSSSVTLVQSSSTPASSAAPSSPRPLMQRSSFFRAHGSCAPPSRRAATMPSNITGQARGSSLQTIRRLGALCAACTLVKRRMDLVTSSGGVPLCAFDTRSSTSLTRAGKLSRVHLAHAHKDQTSTSHLIPKQSS